MSVNLVPNVKSIRATFVAALDSLIQEGDLPVIDYATLTLPKTTSPAKIIDSLVNQLRVPLKEKGYTVKLKPHSVQKGIVTEPYFKFNNCDLCFKHFRTNTIIGSITPSHCKKEILIMCISKDPVVLPNIKTHHVGIHNDFEVVWISRTNPMDVQIFNYRTKEEVEAATGLRIIGGKPFVRSSTKVPLNLPFAG